MVKIPELVNLVNQHLEASEIITSSPYKRKLGQDQEKKIETNKNQIKTKQQKTKSKLKQIVKSKN